MPQYATLNKLGTGEELVECFMDEEIIGYGSLVGPSEMELDVPVSDSRAGIKQSLETVFGEFHMAAWKKTTEYMAKQKQLYVDVH